MNLHNEANNLSIILSLIDKTSILVRGVRRSRMAPPVAKKHRVHDDPIYCSAFPHRGSPIGEALIRKAVRNLL